MPRRSAPLVPSDGGVVVGAPSEPGTRGLAGAIGKKLLKVLVFPLVERPSARSPTASPGAGRPRRPYRVRHSTPDDFATRGGRYVQASEWDDLSGKRALLLAHGEARSSSVSWLARAGRDRGGQSCSASGTSIGNAAPPSVQPAGSAQRDREHSPRSSVRSVLATRSSPASSGAAATPRAASLPVSDKRGHALRSFDGLRDTSRAPATRLLAELQTGPSKRVIAPSEDRGDLVPTPALCTARVAPYPALARGAIGRPFVIVRRVVQVRLDGRFCAS